ncbi:hypothetical protein COB64_03700 [Candidatus Wolfebacteria bacterium]|nr:MAG: hypothetical protein COB64_03700 [Candidatus Wolfebacteria bacterium]
MIIPFISFLVSLVAIIAIIYIRVIEIRKGAISPNIYNREGLTFSRLLPQQQTSLKKYGHTLVLIILKYWIKLQYAVKKIKNKLFPKVSTPLGNKKKSSNGTVSNFFSSINQYKKELGRIKNEMKKDLSTDVEEQERVK